MRRIAVLGSCGVLSDRIAPALVHRVAAPPSPLDNDPVPLDRHADLGSRPAPPHTHPPTRAASVFVPSSTARTRAASSRTCGALAVDLVRSQKLDHVAGEFPPLVAPSRCKLRNMQRDIQRRAGRNARCANK